MKENKNVVQRKNIQQKNDVYEKELRQHLENDIAEIIISYYSKAPTGKDVERFIRYLKHSQKENNSNNSYSNRIYSLYQFLIEYYSNFVELETIISSK